MKTELVNIFASSYDIYVDSPANGSDPSAIDPGEYGFLGNPHINGSDFENQKAFEDYFLDRVKTDPYFRRAVVSMYGKRLGCIGDPEKSHARIVLTWLGTKSEEYERVFGPFNTRRF